jgi:hypothetical protein
MSTEVSLRPIQDERTRGKKLEAFVRRGKMPFEEGLRKADRENRVIASDRRLSMVEEHTKEWLGIIDALHCWTGTAAAYVEPGRELGEKVEYTDSRTGLRWIFPVPARLRHEKDALLVSEHPDFYLEADGKDRVFHCDSVRIVRGFPASNGFYRSDPESGMPVGEALDYTARDARMLWRTSKWTGPASLGSGMRRYIYLYDKPSDRHGIVTEA